MSVSHFQEAHFHPMLPSLLLPGRTAHLHKHMCFSDLRKTKRDTDTLFSRGSAGLLHSLLRHRFPIWMRHRHDSITQLLRICRLHLEWIQIGVSGTNNHAAFVTWIIFLTHSAACFGLQQIVLTKSTCLNVGATWSADCWGHVLKQIN